MNSNFKARNLIVESFRGINDEICLDLEDFTIIHGENGMGKSSFANSLEFLFQKKLEITSRTTVANDVHVNKNSSKSDVRIELDFDNDEYIMLKGTRIFNSPVFSDIISDPFFKNASFVINRNKLLTFVEGSSGDRYNRIMKLLGFKKLDKIQSVLSPAIKTVKQEVKYKNDSYENDLNRLDDLIQAKESASRAILNIKNRNDSALQSLSDFKDTNDSILKDIEKSTVQNKEDIEKLSRLMNKNEEEYKKFLDDINADLESKGLELIDSDTDIEGYKRKLLSSGPFILDNKIEDFNKDYEKLDFDIFDDLDGVLKDYENVATDNLKSSRYLIKTLETSMEYIKFTNTDTCPICNSNIDCEGILGEISQKISQINSSNDAYESWKRNLNSFISNLDKEIRKYERLNDKILEINELAGSNIELIDLSILHDLKSYLKDFSEFKKLPSDFNIFNFDEFKGNVHSIKIRVEGTQLNHEKEEYLKIIDKLTDFNVFKQSDVEATTLKRQITQRENEIEQKHREIEHRKRESERLSQEIEQSKIESERLSRQVEQYEAEIEELEEYIKDYDKELEELKRQLETAEKTFEIFTSTKKNFIDNILELMMDDITYFYNYIHEGDEIANPKIDAVGSRAKGIDVNLDSFGEYVDSRSYASEGHLDTLGLCMFLAFNKRLNGLNLIVLDDVLTTVDEPHKERIARLLLEEFEGFQFIITAHNASWVDQLESLCSDYGRESIVYEIEDWSLDEGPVLSQRF